jgi:hypothetical protein
MVTAAAECGERKLARAVQRPPKVAGDCLTSNL